MRAGPLSDDRVISIVNEYFIPVGLNVTQEGFPVEHIAALRYAQHIFETNWRFEFGFASCFAVENEGQYPIGFPIPEDLGNQFTGDTYYKFIIDALERHRKIGEIRSSFRRGDFVGGLSGMQAMQQELIKLAIEQSTKMVALRQAWEQNAPTHQQF